MYVARLLLIAGVPVLLSLGGCLSVARLSDLPADSGSADIDNTSKDARYGRFEHTFSVQGASRQQVFDGAQVALTQEGFTIASADYDKGCIQGERGLRANEWGMVSGVYLHEADNEVKGKVICIITQDITGGWRQSYAENIADRIERLVGMSR